MNIKALAAAALVTVGGVTASTPSASAAESWECGRLMGYHTCVINRSTIDSMKIEWTNGDYTWMTVNCADRSYSVKHGGRYVSERQTDAITGQWCFG